MPHDAFVSLSSLNLNRRPMRRVGSSKKNYVIEKKIVPIKSKIYILGQMPTLSFIVLGKDLGFDIEMMKEDLYKLIGVKGLIYNEITSSQFLRKIEIFNFCLSYGIPLTWMHSYVAPINWMSQFDNIYVGKFEDYEIWRQLCELD